IDEAARHVERRLGRDVGDWIREQIAEPLGMDGLEWSGSPSVGAHGALTDLALFAAELLRPTLLEQRWWAEMTGVQFPELVGIMPGFGKQSPNPFGLGIEVRGTKSPHWTGAHNSPATFGHIGMRGTAFWVDPVADLALVVGTSHDFYDAHREVMPRPVRAHLHARAPFLVVPRRRLRPRGRHVPRLLRRPPRGHAPPVRRGAGRARLRAPGRAMTRRARGRLRVSGAPGSGVSGRW